MKIFILRLSAVVLGTALLTLAVASPRVVLADTPTFLPSGVTADDIDLGQNDPVVTTVNVVNWSLGILGLLAVLFIIYAGFMWLTAAGSEDRVETAKEILKAAVIGLVIIMVSYGVAQYVFTVLIDVTGSAEETSLLVDALRA